MNRTTEVPQPKQYYRIETHPSATAVPLWMLKLFERNNTRVLDNYRTSFDAQKSHMEISRRRINEASDIALERAARMGEQKPKKALILGGGNCNDIPLEDLTRKFDEVTIMEADRVSVEAAVKRLNPDSQQKIKIVIADITGITGEYANALMPHAIQSDTEEFGEKALAITEELNVTGKSPEIGIDYTFVSSQLMMSQMGYFSYRALESIAEQVSATPVEGTSLRPFLRKIYKQLTGKLQNEHIRYLARLISPEGIVYFSDAYYVRSHNEEWQEYFNHRPVTRTIDKNFTPVAPQGHWKWENIPGRTEYHVIANILEAKKE